MANLDIKLIVDSAGGYDAVAEAVGLSSSAVRKWAVNGIPDRYWSTLIRLSAGRRSVRPLDLFRLNEGVRAEQTARV